MGYKEVVNFKIKAWVRTLKVRVLLLLDHFKWRA